MNEKTLEHYLETTVGIVTALNPVLGYEKATELAGEAYRSGKGILEIIREKKILSEEQIRELLDPVKLTGLDKNHYPSRSSARCRPIRGDAIMRLSSQDTRSALVLMAAGHERQPVGLRKRRSRMWPSWLPAAPSPGPPKAERRRVISPVR